MRERIRNKDRKKRHVKTKSKAQKPDGIRHRRRRKIEW